MVKKIVLVLGATLLIVIAVVTLKPDAREMTDSEIVARKTEIALDLKAITDSTNELKAIQ